MIPIKTSKKKNDSVLCHIQVNIFREILNVSKVSVKTPSMVQKDQFENYFYSIEVYETILLYANYLCEE